MPARSVGDMKRSSTRPTSVSIRRLSAELGIARPHDGAIGLLLGVLLIGAVGGLLIAFSLSGGPPTVVFGAVQGFGLNETDYGTFPLARVRIDDRDALVPISRGATCKVGDRIKLIRRRSLLGYRYSQELPRACG